ncbi:hypothetical protein ACUNWD_15395 [Sunxiuqinia sp. A32]|uniref:hypothetical protein n=1 Tax=Sunxiuqinia sp. A32 TaxID=3461496 RepID=UPI0040457381
MIVILISVICATLKANNAIKSSPIDNDFDDARDMKKSSILIYYEAGGPAIEKSESPDKVIADSISIKNFIEQNKLNEKKDIKYSDSNTLTPGVKKNLKKTINSPVNAVQKVGEWHSSPDDDSSGTDKEK